MSTRRDLLALTTGAAVGAAVPAPAAAAAPAAPGGWVATWAAPPTTVPPGGVTTLIDRTVRHVVHTSIGGDQLRVRLTNEFGTTALTVGEVRVAIRDGDGASTDAVAGTDRRVTFGGSGQAWIPAGAPLVSDPVHLPVAAGQDLLVSLHLPGPAPVTTLAGFAYQDNVIADGNVARSRTLTATTTIGQVFFLSGVSVRTRGSAIVTLGDSITNGANTVGNLNHRWPDLLAARLRAAGIPRGVANVGISGNRLLHDPNPPAGSDATGFAALFGQSALRRLDRDVLSQPGAEHLITLIGINDLGHPDGSTAPVTEEVSAADLIRGHRQLIARARQAGLRVHGGTVLPCKGDAFGFFSVANERKRQTLNKWIRTGGEYDSVLDFDRAMRDPADPQALNPAYDSGDHLHPNDAGMAALAAAVPVRLFR